MDKLETNLVIDYELNSVNQGQVLIRHINNLLHYYNQQINIEVVCYGPGVKSILKSGSLIECEEINKLIEKNVTFLACRNTMIALNINEDKLCPNVQIVSSGMGHLVDRQKQGYAYYKAI